MSRTIHSNALNASNIYVQCTRSLQHLVNALKASKTWFQGNKWLRHFSPMYLMFPPLDLNVLQVSNTSVQCIKCLSPVINAQEVYITWFQRNSCVWHLISMYSMPSTLHFNALKVSNIWFFYTVCFQHLIRALDVSKICLQCNKCIRSWISRHYVLPTLEFIELDASNIWLQCSNCTQHMILMHNLYAVLKPAIKIGANGRNSFVSAIIIQTCQCSILTTYCHRSYDE